MITHVRDLLINLIVPFIDKVHGPTGTIQPRFILKLKCIITHWSSYSKKWYLRHRH